MDINQYAAELSFPANWYVYVVGEPLYFAIEAWLDFETSDSFLLDLTDDHKSCTNGIAFFRSETEATYFAQVWGGQVGRMPTEAGCPNNFT